MIHRVNWDLIFFNLSGFIMCHSCFSASPISTLVPKIFPVPFYPLAYTHAFLTFTAPHPHFHRTQSYPPSVGRGPQLSIPQKGLPHPSLPPPWAVIMERHALCAPLCILSGNICLTGSLTKHLPSLPSKKLYKGKNWVPSCSPLCPQHLHAFGL